VQILQGETINHICHHKKCEKKIIVVKTINQTERMDSLSGETNAPSVSKSGRGSMERALEKRQEDGRETRGELPSGSRPNPESDRAICCNNFRL